MALILGIETSCDETSAGVVAGGYDVRSSVIATQFDLHAKFGGIVPEIASRAHIEKIDGVIQEALERAGASRQTIDAIAVTYTPGLVGSLLIGVTAAKTLAWAWSKPLIGINHVHAHACSAAIALGRAPWPAVALVVSGGHTSLYHVRGFEDIERIGATIDDAAGEAFDKVASILNLGFPGGPIVDRTAAGGNPKAHEYPRTMLGRESLDFSFSGIKTAVLYGVHGPGKTTGGLERLSPQDIANVAASFQAAVVDVLVAKTMRAVALTGTKTVVVGGGVAANTHLRIELAKACERAGVELHLTPMAYCTDNGAMVAALAEHHLQAGRFSDLNLEAKA